MQSWFDDDDDDDESLMQNYAEQNYYSELKHGEQ